MREKVPDLIGAGLLMVLGAAFAVGAASGFQLFGEGGRIGSGFMPFAAGVLLVVFGAMIGGEALLERRPEGTGQDESDGGSRSTVAVVFGLTLAAVLLIPVLGFLVSFGLLVFALVAFVEEGGLPLGAGMGIVAAFLTWLVFVLFLAIPLPGGLLGIGG